MKKNMKNHFSKVLIAVSLAVQLSGCGTNSDYIDILNSTNFPEIGAFTTSGTYNSGIPYTASTPYWRFNTSSYGNYQAPNRGVIGEVGLGTSTIIPGSSYVTIIHSARLATRVHGLTTVSVRAGDVVTLNGMVGVFFNSTSVAFQVFVDGVSVCPLSYVNATLRANLFNNPCQ